MVLRAAGSSVATDGTATLCRELLQLIYGTSHRCAVNNMLLQEWRTHSSAFARLWMQQMQSRRKLVRVDSGSQLTERVRSALSPHYPPDAWANIEKDLHLVHAALATGGIIISADARARLAFTTACGQIRELGRICWIKPEADGDLLFRWLRGDAEAPRAWNLDPTRESA